MKLFPWCEYNVLLVQQDSLDSSNLRIWLVIALVVWLAVSTFVLQGQKKKMTKIELHKITSYIIFFNRLKA